jgi:hypothetical protein
VNLVCRVALVNTVTGANNDCVFGGYYTYILALKTLIVIERNLGAWTDPESVSVVDVLPRLGS